MSWCMQELPEGIPIVFASAVFGMAPNSTAMVRKRWTLACRSLPNCANSKRDTLRDLVSLGSVTCGGASDGRAAGDGGGGDAGARGAERGGSAGGAAPSRARRPQGPPPLRLPRPSRCRLVGRRAR
eukprot:2805165-Rhodomonas_salina.1